MIFDFIVKILSWDVQMENEKNIYITICLSTEPKQGLLGSDNHSVVQFQKNIFISTITHC
jgi:hypothetical protein